MRNVMLVACLGASLNCACSLIFVKGPPAAAQSLPPSEPIECTTGKAAPVIDTLIAGYQVFRTGYALSKTDADYSGAPISRNADIGFGVGLAALFAASAIHGYVTTGECAEVKAAHESRGPRPADESATPETFTVSPNRPGTGNPVPAPRANPAPEPRPSNARHSTVAPVAPATDEVSPPPSATVPEPEPPKSPW